MTVRVRYDDLDKAREEFLKAGLDATAFAGCSEEEIALLSSFQQEILLKSYNDYHSMIEYCNTNYMYAMEYIKRKEAFASYAAANAKITPDDPVKFTTVIIYKNAMKFELNSLNKYFYVNLATEEDLTRARRAPPGRITPDPEQVFERYYSGYSGCLSLVCLAFAAIGYLLTICTT
jgi:hypothetical protein